MEFETIKLEMAIQSANTGADAIKRAPIVDYETDYRCLRIGDISNNREFTRWGFTSVEESVKNKFTLKKNDVLIARTGNTIGVSTIIETDLDAVFNNGLIRLKVNDNFSPRFIYYLVSSEMFKRFIEQISGGTSTQPNVKIKHVLEFPIPKISLNMQSRIAHILTIIDYKIKSNNCIISKLEQISQTLFKHWFIDFEFPNEQGQPYKSSGGEMVESELGEIPKGWKINSLDKIANYQNGLAMQKYRPMESEKKSLPVLKIKELNQGFTDVNSDRCSINIKDSVKVLNGDVIFSWSGTLLVKLWTGGEAGLNQHLFKVTSCDFQKWFYYLWTKHYLTVFQARAAEKATTMGHIKRAHLEEAKAVIPKLIQLEVANKTFEPIIEQIIALGIENKKLQELRDTLLPKLLSGEIEIPDELEVK